MNVDEPRERAGWSMARRQKERALVPSALRGNARVTLRDGRTVQVRAVAIVDALRQAGFKIYLVDRGLRFSVEPASAIPHELFNLVDGSLRLRDDILAVLADDQRPPSA